MEEKKRSWNEKHPELEEGEMFLTNSLIESSSDYTRIGWHTKRKGKKAYTIEGEGLAGYTPVFIQRKEYEEGMK